MCYCLSDKDLLKKYHGDETLVKGIVASKDSYMEAFILLSCKINIDSTICKTKNGLNCKTMCSREEKDNQWQENPDVPASWQTRPGASALEVYALPHLRG